jgi:hypothetical protein
VADSGLNFAPWFTRHYLAQLRVEARKVNEQPRPGELQQLRRRVADLERRLSTAEASCTKLRHFVFKDPGAGEDQLPPLLDIIARVTAKIRKELGGRLDALEARPRMLYQGVWDAGTSYVPGDSVTRSGSLWMALAASVGADPKDSPGFWQLCCKAGRDRRPAPAKEPVVR